MSDYRHGTSVALLDVTPDDHVFRPGESFNAAVAFLPQNQLPTVGLQLLVYVGPRGGDKQVFRLYHGVAGHTPDVGSLMFKYTFPANITSNTTFEIGWDQQMQFRWEDALRSFKAKGQQQHLLRTVEAAP